MILRNTVHILVDACRQGKEVNLILHIIQRGEMVLQIRTYVTQDVPSCVDRTVQIMADSKERELVSRMYTNRKKKHGKTMS